MASFLQPNSVVQSEPQAQSRLRGRGGDFHCSLGVAAENLQPSFLYHTPAQGCLKNRITLFFHPFNKYLVNTCDGPGSVLGLRTEWKPNTIRTLLSWSWCSGGHRKQRSNQIHKGNLRLQGLCAKENSRTQREYKVGKQRTSAEVGGRPL